MTRMKGISPLPGTEPSPFADDNADAKDQESINFNDVKDVGAGVDDDALQRAREAEAIGHDDEAVLCYIMGGLHKQVSLRRGVELIRAV